MKTSNLIKKQNCVTVDIGASWIKILNNLTKENQKIKTFAKAKDFIEFMIQLKNSRKLDDETLLLIGFPGVVKNNKILTAPNLVEKADWLGLDLSEALKKNYHEIICMNDADLHGHFVTKGSGCELVLALGTGVGSSLFINGNLVPNLELGHHPFLNQKTYEETLGLVAFESMSREVWLKNLEFAIQLLKKTFQPDFIYLTGGLSEHARGVVESETVIVCGNPVQ